MLPIDLGTFLHTISPFSYCVATSIFGTCKRKKPPIFQMIPKLVKQEIWDALHGNTVSMSSDTTNLVGCSEFLYGKKTEKHFQRAEEIMGPIQDQLCIQIDLKAVSGKSCRYKIK